MTSTGNPTLADRPGEASSRSRVLIVDDTDSNRYTLGRSLSKAGFSVQEAASGWEGLNQAKRARPDLIVLDVQLPDMSGYDVCRLLKASDVTAAIPVLQVSAHFKEPEDLARGLEGGADAYLVHPIQPLVLVATIQSLLRTSRAERESHRLSSALRERADELTEALESQTRLAAIVESTDDAIISMSLEGVIRTWNAAAERMFGYRAEEVTGRSIGLLVPPERRGEETQILERLSQGEHIEHLETVRLAKDGRRVEVSVTISPLKDSEGRIIGASKISRDITQRKRAEEELRRLKDELEIRVEQRTAELAAANKELEAFGYSVSHDLRAPLRHVASFIELLDRRAGPALDETNRRYVRTISEAARRMGSLIDDLLTLSRIGRAAMSERNVSLRELVEEARRELAPETNGRAIDWQIGPLACVSGDPALLRVAMVNLLSNAIKYTRKRNPARIEIGSWERDDEVVCFVKDNGAGFDMRFADKLFGVFQRLHRAEDFEGTGIGLASVQRIIQRHGGRTWAEGAVDQGATFYFALPRSSRKP